MPPDISVIIAAYNVENYIERAIFSVLEQQGVTTEIILVDDCSTDDTWKIVSQIQDPRLKCVQLPQNQGPASARNAGIAAATAPWIAILDGDDVFLPGRINRLLARATAENADIVVDNLQVLNEADNTNSLMFAPSRLKHNPKMDLVNFMAGNQLFLGGYTYGYMKPIFSTAFLQKYNLNYDPDLRIGEDYIFLADALANGAVCAIEPEVGYLYTARKGSISHRLTLSDVERIRSGDRKFLSRHQLTRDALTAQHRREFKLREAFAFTKLIDALKEFDIASAFKALASCPTASLQLWRSLAARLQRLIK